MTTKKGKLSSIAESILQAVLIGIVMGALGGLTKTYMDVHDLKLMVQDQRGKIDWLYKYTFPKMDGARDGQ